MFTIAGVLFYGVMIVAMIGTIILHATQIDAEDDSMYINMFGILNGMIGACLFMACMVKFLS